MHTTSVRTRTYAIDKASYFKLLITWHYKKRWWINLLSLVVAFAVLRYLIPDLQADWGIIVLIVIVAATAVRFIGMWRLVNSAGVQKYFLNRYYVMDYDKISSFVEDGSSNVTMINNFIKAETLGSYYILYLNKFQYTFIPMNAFKSTEDKQWFEMHVIGKIKTPGFM